MKNKLLLLHGALGGKKQLKELKGLLQETYEVYDMNFEGHGGETSTNDFSIQLFVANVLVFLKENNIDKINVFGYSMGGYVALNLAISHPNLIAKIVTLGTKFHWNPEESKKEVRLLNPEKIALKVPKFASQLSNLHGEDSWKLVMRSTADMMLDLGDGKCTSLQEFENIKHQVLVSVGGADTMVTLKETKAVSDVLENGQLKVVPGVKHPIDSIDKGIIASMISNFIK